MSPTMWWPSPEAFNDLTVEDADEGFTLSAPDDTECGEWLAHWNQDEEHQKVFNEAFIEVLMNYIKTHDLEHGENENLPDGGTKDRIETEDECPRVQS